MRLVKCSLAVLVLWAAGVSCAAQTQPSAGSSSGIPSDSPSSQEGWVEYTGPQGDFRFSHPPNWTVRTHEGYLAIVESPDRAVAYEVFFEPIEESFAEYKEGVEASTNFEGAPGETVTEGELDVDGSEGFFIQTVYAEEPPPDWAGEEYCRGCVGRGYFFDWRPGQVLVFSGHVEEDWARHVDTIEAIVESLRH